MSRKVNTYKPINPDIWRVIEKHTNNPEAVIEIFKELQEQQGSLSPPVILDIARGLNIPAERAFGVATFYTMLAQPNKPTLPFKNKTIRVCDGPVCWLHGAPELRAVIDAMGHDHPEWAIERTSCLGLCDRAPAALVEDQQAGPLQKEHLPELWEDWRGRATDYAQARPGEVRVMMAKAGIINPDSISSALSHGAYCGLAHSFSRSPEEVLGEVDASGLTGRGGAGFPVGRKWKFVAQAERTPKYVICNADESEPLIFKDRVLIDTNPHQILEGMAIAGYATGASEAFIYIRGEYETQAARLERAIQQAENEGWLGNNIHGSSFSFHIHVHRGAGAYICGEETALIESLEGKRGEPRLRPPYPPTYGYRGMPTLVNNVESYAAVPSILCNGGAWYRSLSNYSTTGTKMYMVLGHVKQPGLFEAPFGLTLRQVIEDFGGGMCSGSAFHFALTGGAAGTIVPETLLDTPMDYASVAKGISLGAGSCLICDQTISPVSFLREILHFFASESCGKCTPCRVGTQRSLEILSAMTSGRGRESYTQELVNLAEVMQAASFCGLGQSVVIPVKSAISHFAEDFQATSSQEAVIH